MEATESTSRKNAKGSGAPRLGHVHLKVRNLNRALEFYHDLLGLEITELVAGKYAFLSSGSAHHEVALQALGNEGVSPLPYSVGLYHAAFEVETPEELLRVWKSIRNHGHRLNAVNHGISWALYLEDPDGNGVEIYLDRRRSSGGREFWNGVVEQLTMAEVEREIGVVRV